MKNNLPKLTGSKKNFADICSKIIYSKMLSAQRASNTGPKFYLQDPDPQTESERICKEISEIAGIICTKIHSKKIPEERISEMYSYAEENAKKIYNGEVKIKKVVDEF